jgi:tetratricopeptide (TPR) repeat protein
VAIVVSVVTGRAQAQPGDASAAAEQLFEQGRELAQQNRWPEACARFENSLRYEQALGTQLNLARCYKHIGKLASAWRLFREAIAQATEAGDVERRDFARTQADALKPRLPKLTISPQNPPAGLVVARDGAQIDAGAPGVALYVDPGMHTITASAPGFEVFRQTVTLVEGEAETVAIPALVAVPVRATVPAQVQDDSHATTSQPEIAISPTRKDVAAVVGAIGVASIGFGLVFGAKASSSYDDAKALCGSNLACTTENYSRGQQLIRDTRSEATISMVLVAAGVAAVVTGVVVFLTEQRPRERATAQLVPMIYDRGSGLAVTGRF